MRQIYKMCRIIWKIYLPSQLSETAQAKRHQFVRATTCHRASRELVSYIYFSIQIQVGPVQIKFHWIPVSLSQIFLARALHANNKRSPGILHNIHLVSEA